MQELIKEAKEEIKNQKEILVQDYIKDVLTRIEHHKRGELRALRELKEIGDLELDDAYDKVLSMRQMPPSQCYGTSGSR